MRNLYLIISQTGSILSRIISRATGDRYAHISLSLEDDLSEMYSFGRVYAYTPLIGGFVRESLTFGTMKRFHRAQVIVLRIPVEDEKWKEIHEYISTMYKNRKMYHYSFRGAFKAWHGIPFHRENYYYCSEFIKETLEKFSLVDDDEYGEVVRPDEFLRLRRAEEIYRGRLCNCVRI